MDYNRLNSIVEDFINNNKFFVDTLSIVDNYCRSVMEDNVFVSSYDFSRSFDINDSIKIVYSFLESIDSSLANRFMNVLNSKDENGKLLVNILPKSQHPNESSQVRNGVVYIYYDNSPRDCFVILHEMLHKMNECRIIDQDNQETETFTRQYFGELVSIIGEALLGNYMVDNGLITENDFNIRKMERLDGTKENVRDVVVESELIKMKLDDKRISFDNLKQLFDDYDKSSYKYGILMDEWNDKRRTNCILSHDSMNLSISQRYVIALALSYELLKRESAIKDFINLNKAVSDPYSDIFDVYGELISDDYSGNYSSRL